MLDVEAVIRGIIADVRPHVIVTFDPNGGYHPDHLAIQRATTAVFQGLADASRGRGNVDGLDADVFATAPEMIAVSFNASAYLERKFYALTAHRSAFGVTPEMLENPPPGVAQMLQAFRPVFEREVFLLGGARGPVRRWPLPDFFDGLDIRDFSGS